MINGYNLGDKREMLIDSNIIYFIYCMYLLSHFTYIAPMYISNNIYNTVEFIVLRWHFAYTLSHYLTMDFKI